MKYKMKALIMARSGSQRVKNKNSAPFAGSSLLKIKIEQMKRIKSIDGVVVNSNDDFMLDIAKSMGCTPIKRDSYFASEEVSANELYVNIAETFPGDIIVFVNPTNPLVKDETFEATIAEYLNKSDKFDSLNTAHLVKDFLWLDGKAINYTLSKQPKSQDLPDICALDGGVNIITRDRMIECKSCVGKNPNIYIIDSQQGYEIDYPIDFEVAEFLYRKYVLKERGR